MNTNIKKYMYCNYCKTDRMIIDGKIESLGALETDMYDILRGRYLRAILECGHSKIMPETSCFVYDASGGLIGYRDN